MTRILVQGSGVGAALFAYLHAGAAELVLVEGAAKPDAPAAIFDAEQFASLARRAPDIVASLAPEWRVWREVEIRRRGQRTRITTGETHAIAEAALATALRQTVEARGLRWLPAGAAVATEEFDLVIAADGGLGRAADFEVSAVEGGNCVLYAEAPLALETAVVSVRERGEHDFTATFLPLGGRALILIEGPAELSLEDLGTLFAEDLAGQKLVPLGEWQRVAFFAASPRVAGRIALLGRAAAVAHPGFFAEARLEFEDAVALDECLRGESDTHGALAAYQDRRQKPADSLQRASDVTRLWGEHLPHYRAQDGSQFAFNYLTRHYRIDYETVQARDPDFVNALESCFAARSGGAKQVPPMFCPFRVRGLELQNRVVFSPMAMRQGTREAMPTDFHLVHLGSRAMGGAGLVFAEMTNVSPEGRISHNCVGMYRPEHQEAWRRIVDFVHTQSSAKIALQLGHAGRKGSTRRAPDGRNLPLEDEGWELLSASAIAWSARSSVPREADRADMDKVVGDYVRAARMGLAAGFDLLELHMAHGYLLSSFISPLSNRRGDAYGGSLKNRMRFPLEVLAAVRAEWPAEKPLSVRISAYDWLPEGLSLDEAVALTAMLKSAGCDIVTVSSGHTSSGVGAGPDHGRLYQAPFSDRIRNEVGIATIAVGTIFSWGDVNAMLAAGRADLCALGRGHLYDPYFTRHAALAQGHTLPWPSSYRTAALFKPHGVG